MNKKRKALTQRQIERFCQKPGVPICGHLSKMTAGAAVCLRGTEMDVGFNGKPNCPPPAMSRTKRRRQQQPASVIKLRRGKGKGNKQ